MKNSELRASPDIRAELQARIVGRPAIVGIGNIMRGDDGLGPKMIELLKARSANAFLFDCGTAPENYIFPILTTSCDTIILIDAADLGAAPGDVRIIDVDDIATIGFSTHNPSPRLLIDLLRTGKENLTIFAVAVQPKRTTLGEPLSDEIKERLGLLADTFAAILA